MSQYSANQRLISVNLGEIFHNSRKENPSKSTLYVDFSPGLKIRVSVVQFHPWPPSFNNLSASASISCLISALLSNIFAPGRALPRFAQVHLPRRAWIIMRQAFGRVLWVRFVTRTLGSEIVKRERLGDRVLRDSLLNEPVPVCAKTAF